MAGYLRSAEHVEHDTCRRPSQLRRPAVLSFELNHLARELLTEVFGAHAGTSDLPMTHTCGAAAACHVLMSAAAGRAGIRAC